MLGTIFFYFSIFFYQQIFSLYASKEHFQLTYHWQSTITNLSFISDYLTRKLNLFCEAYCENEEAFMKSLRCLNYQNKVLMEKNLEKMIKSFNFYAVLYFIF